MLSIAFNLRPYGWASAHTPKHTPLMWLGDQLVSWDAHDGMKSSLMGMLQGGLSGLSMSHSDIGGRGVLHSCVLHPFSAQLEPCYS